MKMIVEGVGDKFYLYVMCTTSVSYTHLDVYKRQVAHFVVGIRWEQCNTREYRKATVEY